MSRMWVEVRRNPLVIDAGFLVLQALLIVTITFLYISSEQNFHWWIDWYERTLEVVNALRESPLKAMQLVGQSLAGERNRLFTLPLIPFILVFGSSRLVYEIALALVYLLPFALVMGAIATQLIPVHTRTVFWFTSFLTLLLPVSWISTFMGIPDTGGAALIGLATFVYLQDGRRGKVYHPLRQWWRIPLIGVLIGLAILLRRHFVYGGLAFLSALSLQSVLFFIAEVRQQPFKDAIARQASLRKPIALRWGKALLNLLLRNVQVSLIGAATLVTLFLVAPQFTYAALFNDYRAFYISWSLPFSDITNLYASFYGWGTWLIVAIGFSASLFIRALALPTLSVMGFSGVLSLIVWLVILRYGNVFYSLHVTPLVVIGLVAFIWTTWVSLRGKKRAFMLGVVGCYLVVNLGIGLAPIGGMSRLFHPLFALNMPPLVRTDYDEVVRLVNYLRLLTPNEEPIFIVGYQRLQLTSTMVKAVERVLYPSQKRFLNVLRTPEVDSRDSYPLEPLLEAQYVVIPSQLPNYSSDPTQLPAVGEWLLTQEHDVVNVVFDAFTQNWDFAQDFKRLPMQFTFENGVKVSIYERIRPTSLATAVRTLNAMQWQLGTRPGSQQNWIVLSQWLHNTSVRQNSDYTYRLVSFHRDFETNWLAKEWSERSQNRSDRIKQTGKNSEMVAGREQPGNSQQELISSSEAELVLANPQQLAWQSQLQASEVKKQRNLADEDRTQQLGTSLLYLGPVPERAKVAGVITYLDRICRGSSLRIAMLDRKGDIVSSTETTYKHNPKKATQFELSLHGKNASYLLFNLLNYDKNEFLNSCTMEIRSLSVLPEK
ncbi:MAG TPA: hypothetical protein V6C91_10330 [Coleofasciculaceae cyanobacterium]